MSVLTRMLLNPARRGTRMLLASPQAMHAAVLAGFPPDSHTSDGSAGRVLWRLDHDTAHKALLYICSPTRPDLTHLVEQAGWPAAEQTWQSRDYTVLLNRLAEGQHWAFRLTANPVHGVRTGPTGSRGTPRGHVTPQQQTGWLLARAEQAGFAIPTTAANEPAVTVRDRKIVTFARDKAAVTIARATFDGVLVVTDPGRLRRAMTHGIGRAKAYGCGMLTLAAP